MSETASSRARPPAVRLSATPLWQWQRDYFDRRGNTAWSWGEVPQYITTNSFIAACYGRVIEAWIRALDALGPAASRTTIVELGAGSGRFGFGMLRHLETSGLAVRYVMTDLSHANIGFWRGHPHLRRFIEDGTLDFARFDPEKDGAIHPMLSGDAVDGSEERVIVIANYFFDGIAQDLFASVGGELHESRVSVLPPENVGQADGKFFAQMDVKLTNVAAHSPYEDAVWSRVVERYGRRPEDGTFLFPTGALRVIERLKNMMGGRLLLLTADHGADREEMVPACDGLPLALHGSFSLPVNYAAIGEVVEAADGRLMRLDEIPSQLATVALAQGFGEAEFTAIERGFAQGMGPLGPDGFFALKKTMDRFVSAFTLEELLLTLRFSYWDPEMFRQSAVWLAQRAPGATAQQRDEIVAAIENVWAQYFPMSGADNFSARIAEVLLACGFADRALDYLRAPGSNADASAEALTRMAQACLQMGDAAEAASKLDAALALEPEFALALECRAAMQGVSGEPHA